MKLYSSKGENFSVFHFEGKQLQYYSFQFFLRYFVPKNCRLFPAKVVLHDSNNFEMSSLPLRYFSKSNRSMTKPQNDLYAQQRCRSARASTQFDTYINLKSDTSTQCDQSLCCALMGIFGPKPSNGGERRWADTHADLSLTGHFFCSSFNCY